MSRYHLIVVMMILLLAACTTVAPSDQGARTIVQISTSSGSTSLPSEMTVVNASGVTIAYTLTLASNMEASVSTNQETGTIPNGDDITLKRGGLVWSPAQ